jgi:outer membrane scaffolding protein for murein synthesis (MipA/OmpV family)
MLIQTTRIQYLTAAITIAVLFTGSHTVQAQDYARNSDWDVTLGAGVAYGPTYEGSNDYTVTPLPYINIRYKDRIGLGKNGLTADILKNDESKIGIGLTYDMGRDEDGDTLFGSDDDTLDGMGDIDGAVGLKAYAAHDFVPVTVSGSITQYVGDDNDGLLVDAKLSKRFPLSRQLSLTASLGTTWADDDYMSTFFGVDTGQAARSQFSQYNAESGFKDISVGINAMYLLNKNWFIMGGGKVKQLLNDAADSPVSQDDTNFSLISSIGYKF